jgi:hypothetical protein
MWLEIPRYLGSTIRSLKTVNAAALKAESSQSLSAR